MTSDKPTTDGGDSSAQPDPAAGGVVGRASLRRNVAQMGSSQVVTWALATITSIVVPRFLGPSPLGELALAAAIWTIVSTWSNLGTTMHLQRSIAGNQRHGLSLITPVFMVRLVAFVSATAALCVVGVVSGVDDGFALIVALTGVGAFIGLCTDVYTTVFVGLERMATAALLPVVGRAVALSLTILVLLVGGGVVGVVAVGVATALLTLVLVRRRFVKMNLPRSRAWRGQLRAVARASAPFMLVTLALTTYHQVDVIIIGQVAGTRDVGWYSAADVLVGSLLFPTTILMTSMFPAFVRTHAANQGAFEDLVRRTFSILLLAAVPIGFGAMVVSPAFSSLLYGDEFQGTGAVVSIMSIVTMFTFGATLFAYAAFALGKETFVAMLIFAAAALTIPLDMLFVPWAERRYDNGAIGGAFSYVVTETAQFVILFAVIAPFVASRALAWKAVRVLAAGLAMAVLVWPLRNIFVLVPATVGGIVYAVLIVLFGGLDGYERDLVREALHRLRRSKQPGSADQPDASLDQPT